MRSLAIFATSIPLGISLLVAACGGSTSSDVDTTAPAGGTAGAAGATAGASGHASGASGATGGTAGGAGKPGECETVMDCPLAGMPCMQCPDGTTSCPSTQCLDGKCVQKDYDCKTSCNAMDATGVGACKGMLGYKWNGTTCVMVTGCSCEGADCAKLTGQEACFAGHKLCAPGKTPCKDAACGATCSPCVSDPCPPVIGYCDASGTCGPNIPVCPSTCDPQDAVGDGPCDAFLGYKWDGKSCQAITGCTCKGKDCGALPISKDVCETSHVACGVPGTCGLEDAIGSGTCDGFFGYKWDGAGCVAVYGCKCTGTACGNLPMGEDACLSAHAACQCEGKACGDPCQCVTPPCANTPYFCDDKLACQPGPATCFQP